MLQVQDYYTHLSGTTHTIYVSILRRSHSTKKPIMRPCATRVGDIDICNTKQT